MRVDGYITDDGVTTTARRRTLGEVISFPSPLSRGLKRHARSHGVSRKVRTKEVPIERLILTFCNSHDVAKMRPRVRHKRVRASAKGAYSASANRSMISLGFSRFRVPLCRTTHYHCFLKGFREYIGTNTNKRHEKRRHGDTRRREMKHKGTRRTNKTREMERLQMVRRPEPLDAKGRRKWQNLGTRRNALYSTCIISRKSQKRPMESQTSMHGYPLSSQQGT